MPRPRPPAWLKPLILPAWNAGHHLARRARDFLDALRHRRFDRCTCCGAFALMLLRPRVVPPRLAEMWGLSPRVAAALVRKESLDCSRCGAKLRARRIARVLLELYPTCEPVRSVAAWARRPEARGFRVAELNVIDGLHAALSMLAALSFSDFHEGVCRGSYVDGVRNEDLAALTYTDASFDIVLTSETLEHVPDLSAALAEIRRVLVPGGRHVFSVPALPGVATSFARSVRDADGSVRHLAPPLCHPGGDSGYPVFTEFGADLPEILRGAGFEVSVHFGPTTEDDLTQVYVCRKPMS